MLKKGLVVLFASLFVSGVFAAQSDSANTTNQTEPHATQLVKKKHELCKKAMKCHTNKAGKKVCKKMCKKGHKHMKEAAH